LHAIENNRKFSPGYLIKYLNFVFNIRSHFHRRLITFLFFVLISTGFWIVRSLGEQYETNVSYPVKYTNFPENKILIGEVPQKLELRIQANGFSILKSRLNLKLIPLRFDINSFALNNLGTDTFIIITETIKDILSEELAQVKILDISPDTLFLRFARIVSRKVAVVPVLSLHEKFFRQQFTQNGDITVVPDSILISGPGNVVGQTSVIYTEALSFTDLSSNVTSDCNLKPEEMLTYSIHKVQVTIPVDRFTEVEESLSVQPVNVPDSLIMIPIPGKVKATYRICLSNYRKVVHNPLAPRINYQEINEGQTHRLTVFLADTPGIVSNLRFNPDEVEFLITRK